MNLWDEWSPRPRWKVKCTLMEVFLIRCWVFYENVSVCWNEAGCCLCFRTIWLKCVNFWQTFKQSRPVCSTKSLPYVGEQSRPHRPARLTLHCRPARIRSAPLSLHWRLLSNTIETTQRIKVHDFSLKENLQMNQKHHELSQTRKSCLKKLLLSSDFMCKCINSQYPHNAQHCNVCKTSYSATQPFLSRYLWRKKGSWCFMFNVS